jgi:MFS family permease
MLVGVNNFLVATCNFTVQYFFPMWFQTVMLTSPSVAGLHLTPNSIFMSLGSLFAGWMMHRTGKYKALNIVFGILPTIAAFNIARLTENSSQFQQWFTIIPLGFGNAVVFQTTLIALLAFLPKSAIAVGTGFTQLFRGIGQVSGVAISSAIFQDRLDHELHQRLSNLDEDLISRIRHSSTLVASLPPEIQRAARDSYAASLKTVFIFATTCTFAAFVVRLPIPEQSLDEPEDPKAVAVPEVSANAGVNRVEISSQLA